MKVIPEKLSTKKVGENIPCRHPMSMMWKYVIENKHNVSRGEDCMKTF